MPVPEYERHLSNTFFKCIGSRIIDGEIICVNGLYKPFLDHYIQKKERRVDANKYVFFFRGCDVCSVIKMLNELPNKRMLKVQLFYSDNRIEPYQLLNKLPITAIKHMDGIGFYEINIDGYDQTIQTLNEISNMIKKIDKSNAEIPGWLRYRVLERRGDVDGLYDWSKRLGLIQNNLTFDSQIGIPNLIMEEDFYDSYYTFKSVELEYLISKVEIQDQKYKLIYRNKKADFSYRANITVGIIQAVIGAVSVNKKGTVKWLDYACGSGQMIHMVNPGVVGCEDFEITGVDTNESKKRIAESYDHDYRKKFIVASDYTQLNMEEYDIVSFFEFIEHLYDPLRFLKDMPLRKDAYLIASVPLEEYMQDYIPGAHIWSWRGQDIIKLLEMAGFQIICKNENIIKYNKSTTNNVIIVARKC